MMSAALEHSEQEVIMRAHTTTRLAGRMAWFAICGVELTGIAACQESATGPQSGSEPMTSAEVIILVSDEHADPGDEVRVNLQLPETERGTEGVIQATVTWDPTSFEYVARQPLRGLEILSSDLESGWMRVQASYLRFVEDGGIRLTFVALRAAETSGFAAHANIRPAAFDG